MLKRIFIVDDSKIVRQLIRTYLENQLDYIVCSEAVDGLDAIQRAKELNPDLVVLDLSMPKINGLEAAAVLHVMFPKMPLILYTLHKDIVPESRAKSVGIRSVVSKTEPVDVLLLEILNFVGVAKAVAAPGN